ncbi:TPA: hypothetical protein ACX6MG_002800 [Photobacterium damselae]
MSQPRGSIPLFSSLLATSINSSSEYDSGLAILFTFTFVLEAPNGFVS